MHRRNTVAAAFCAAALLAAGDAGAQLGLYTLPKNNFMWQWGDTREGARRAFEDFSVNGGEAGFRCELTGKLSVASRMTPADVRELEQSLSTRLDFIYAASDLMNYLDQTRELDWATLDCKKPEEAPVSEEQRAERESKAREKMLRELERRRARDRARDDAG